MNDTSSSRDVFLGSNEYNRHLHTALERFVQAKRKYNYERIASKMIKAIDLCQGGQHFDAFLTPLVFRNVQSLFDDGVE